MKKNYLILLINVESNALLVMDLIKFSMYENFIWQSDLEFPFGKGILNNSNKKS